MAINKEELVQRGKYGLRRAIFSRTGLVALLFLVQVGLLISVMVWFQEWQAHVMGGSLALTMAAVLVVLNSDLDPTAKLTWMVVMTIVPVFGALFYWYTRRDVGHRMLKAVMTERQVQSRHQLSQDPAVWKALSAREPGAAGMARYVRRSGCFPVFGGTEVTYYPMGEDYFEGLLRELEKAEKFIFMEYFILDEGYFWDSVLDVLKRKAASGVDVRVMYDGTCEFVLLPRHYPKELEKFGIQCQVFAPLEPFVSTHYNYRDHRKITVIDGKVAFTGGINLADEYINAVEKYGHWRDSAIQLRGDAAWSFALIFLQMWQMVTKQHEDIDRYRPAAASGTQDGFVQPYADSPTDDDNVGEHVYLQIINNAKRYLYINTPYLIVDDSMISALCLTAKSGVDVRILTPHRWDKRIVHFTTRSYYRELLRSGVKIYEYTIGFNHAKTFVSDDAVATVGTTNLDFRSLYHHFECGTVLYGSRAVMEVKEDFLNTLPICHGITQEELRSNVFVRMAQDVLRLFAPLM